MSPVAKLIKYFDTAWSCAAGTIMMSVHGQHPERKRELTLDSVTLRFGNVGHWIVSTPAGKEGKPSRHNCKKCSIDGRKDA